VLERWELVPSSQPDRYLLKLRGDRADADRIAQTHPGICQDVRELSDPVYQWVVIVTGATLTDRLTLQDDVRALVSRPAAEPVSAGPVDLSGVLAELSLVLEEFKDLTEEEQARVALKMEQIQKKEASIAESAATVTAPSIPPSVPVVPPAPPPSPTPVQTPEPTPAVPEKPAESPAPPMQIVRDVAKPPATKPVKTVAPEQPVKKQEERRPAVPPPAVPEKPAEPPKPAPVSTPAQTSVPPPVVPVKPVESPKPAAPVSAPEPPPAGADEMRIACFYPAGTEEPVKKFLNRLVEVCKTKAKKPFTLNVLVSKPAKIGTILPEDLIQEMRSSGVVSLIVVLPPDILPEYMDHCVAQIKQQSINCHLVEQSDLGTQVIFIDLMVELMMERRKK